MRLFIRAQSLIKQLLPEIPYGASPTYNADRDGSAIPYAIFHFEDRGKFFVLPGDVVYEGMVVGEHSLSNDLNINICKEKKLSNMRASGKDENVILTPVIVLV